MASKWRKKLEKQHLVDKNKFVLMQLGKTEQNINQGLFDANFSLKQRRTSEEQLRPFWTSIRLPTLR